MHAPVGLWLALALLVFWLIGVYNRLMRLRSPGLDALGSVEKRLRRYAELLAPAFTARRNARACVQKDPWSEVQVGLDALDAALKEVRRKPMEPQTMDRLATALHVLQANWGRCAADPAAPDAAALQTPWDTLTQEVQVARVALNQILSAYNQAITQLPARLVATFMGFHTAGHL